VIFSPQRLCGLFQRQPVENCNESEENEQHTLPAVKSNRHVGKAYGFQASRATLDQSTGGDQWHQIAALSLSAKDSPVVRVHNEGTGPAVADALHVRSRTRYSDGSPTPVVALEPMDGIVLAPTPEKVR
jgi:hypothetical protein